MIDLLTIVKTHLIDSKITLPIKLGFMADSPAEVISIYYLEGDNPNIYFSNSPGKISRPRLRIRIRSTSYSKAYQCAIEIRESLNNFKQDDTLGLFADGDIVPLGQDELKRTEFELNYRTLINEYGG